MNGGYFEGYYQTRNKTSWMHPRFKHWHLTDDVIVTKTIGGAGCRQITGLLSANSACAIRLYERQERAKEIGCLQAETRQQVASIHL